MVLSAPGLSYACLADPPPPPRSPLQLASPRPLPRRRIQTATVLRAPGHVRPARARKLVKLPSCRGGSYNYNLGDHYN